MDEYKVVHGNVKNKDTIIGREMGEGMGSPRRMREKGSRASDVSELQI